VNALNHHHLFHFWTVVREGGVTRASERLNVSQPTVSGQLRELQDALGEKLLVRSGRSVVLTDIGRTVYRYADEIFALGRELQQAVKGRVTHPARLAVGVAMVVPKLVAYRILEPALRLPEPIQLDCVHERPERLVAELAIFTLDLVLADTPAPPAVKVRAYSHLLGECGVSVLGTQRLVAAHRAGFPRSLNGAPFLMPSGDSGLRLSLEDWFRKSAIRPRVVGTFEDSALIDAFGRAGAGLLAVPSAIEDEVRQQYGLRLVGRLDSVRQRFYAITVERKLRNPATIAISQRARALFS
jgi:LysR family transcriptional activator of nhaA